MNILFVTWEYPPRDFGSNSQLIKGIAEKLSEKHNVYVVSYDQSSAIERGNPEIHRVPFGIHSNSFFNWALLMNTELKGRCSSLIKEKGIDVIHAFEWPVFPTAISLKKLHQIPLIATLNSTEHQRSGLSDKEASLICDMEWWGCYEAEIVLSEKIARESIMANYRPPEEKLKLCKDENETMAIYEEIENANTALNLGIPPT